MLQHKKMVSKKIRKRSGWRTPRLEDKSMKFDEIKIEALEPQEEYDDWFDHRDGMRDWPGKERKEKEIKKEGWKIRLRRWKKKIK